VWGLASRGVIRDAEGHPLYTIGQIVDITDRKTAEQQLVISEEEIREANHLLEQQA